MMTRHSPAEIIRAYLEAQNPASLVVVGAGKTWVYKAANLPEEPIEAVAIYDTTGTTDGTILQTGETIEHPGIQIVIRAEDFQISREKAASIAKFLESVHHVTITLDSVNYLLEAAQRVSNVVPLGTPLSTRMTGFAWMGESVEKHKEKLRESHAVNFLLTVREK